MVQKDSILSKFDFKTCLSLLCECTAALYAHDEDLSEEDLVYCDFIRSVCMRYCEVYSSEIRVMYRTSSVINDSPDELKND